MNRKRLISCILVSALLFTWTPVYSSAALSDPDDLSKGIKLGLDLTTAIADKQDALEGAKDVLKKEYDDWTWNYVVGNYEKLIFQNAEAELPDFKGKIDKIKEVIERIEKVATQLGAGEYDEAAITALDQVVSTVDHPVVSALWASVKLAYESHKLVQSTRAELHIESLYGVMENDRRLRGSDSGNGLKTFRMNSDTVDYFYNKYLITDSSTREMMKSYVKARLGEEFPEQSYWQSFTNIMSIGSGADYEKNYQLEELEANKNVARRWIAQLLEDLNTQAKVRYAEMRARQQKAEFDKFVERFSMFEKDLPRIIQEFQNQKKLAVEVKEYPKFMTDSQATRKRFEAEYVKLKKTDISIKKKMAESAWEWQLKCLTYSSRATYMGNKELGNSINMERTAWNTLRDRISNDFKISPDEIIDQAYETPVSESDEQRLTQSYFNANFAPLIKPFEFEQNPQDLVTKYLDALNRGAERSEFLEINKNINDMRSNLTSHYSIIEVGIKECVKKYPNVPEDWGDSGNNRKYLKCVAVLSEDRQKSISCSVNNAKSLAIQTNRNARDLQLANFDSAVKQIAELEAAYNELREVRKKQLTQIKKGINENIKYLPFQRDGNSSSWEPEELEMLKFELKNLKAERNTSFYQDGINPGPGQLSSILYDRIKENYSRIQHIETLVGYHKELVENTKIKWGKAASDWNDFVNTLNYTQKEYDQFTVLVSPYFTKKNNIDVYTNIARSDVSRYVSQMKSLISQYEQTANTEINNLNLEITWIADINDEWQKWLNKKIEEGILVKESNGAIKLFIQNGINGMASVQSPYPHYLQQDELDRYQKSISDGLTQLKVYKFMEKNLPNLYQKANDLLLIQKFTPAKEDNFIYPGSSTPIWISNLEKAEAILNNFAYDDQFYANKLEELSKLLLNCIRLGTQRERETEELIAKYTRKPLPPSVDPRIGELREIDESQFDFKLGKRFLDIRKRIKILLDERIKYINTPKKPFVPEDPTDKKLKDLLQEINAHIDRVKNQTVNVEDHFNELAKFRLSYSYINKQSSDVDTALETLEKTILEMLSKTPPKEETQDNTNSEKIKDFYRKFKEAYESCSDYMVMDLISSDWESGDGTTTADLEAHFRRMFNIFNSISFGISGMQIFKVSENLYNISYDLTIKGVNYQRNLRHEEKSSVNEQVIIDKSGKIKINKTLNGRFWYSE